MKTMLRKSIPLALCAALLLSLVPAVFVVPALAAAAQMVYSTVYQPSDSPKVLAEYGGNTLVGNYILGDFGPTTDSYCSIVGSDGTVLQKLPAYEFGEPISFDENGYAFVCKKDGYGYIDYRGNVIVPYECEYSSYPELSNGTAAVRVYDSKNMRSTNYLVDFAKPAGQNMTPLPKSDLIDYGEFGNGRFLGRTKPYEEGDYCYYNTSGQKVSGDYLGASPFTCGYAFVKTVAGDVYDIIDSNYAVKGRFDYSKYCESGDSLPKFTADGLAKISVAAGNTRKIGFIDTTGNLRIPAVYYWSTYPFKNGYARVSLGLDSHSQYITQLIDTSGNYVLPTGINALTDVDPGGRLWISDGTSEKLIQLKPNVTAASLTLCAATESISVPTAKPQSDQAATNSDSLRAVVKDADGNSIEGITWTVTPPVGGSLKGISIDGAGSLTVTNSAAGGTYTVTASCGGKSESKAITVSREPSKTVALLLKCGDYYICNSHHLPIYPSHSSTTTYLAELYDQYGQPSVDDSVDWSSTATSGNGISADKGTITILPTAANSSAVTLTAASHNNPATTAVLVISAESIPSKWAYYSGGYNPNTKRIEIRLNISSDSTLSIDYHCFLAAYDKQGKLIRTSSQRNSSSNGDQTLAIDCSDNAVKSVKAFVLDQQDCAPLLASSDSYSVG